MEKLNIVNTFTNYVDQLRNTECSQKEKISCFQHIGECILSPAMVAHVNYATHCSRATNVLLMFCEDLDSTVRMSAEENLNRIFRAFERTRVSRILLDLYGEIKRNGNERSLRICLNLFAYYAPQVKERNIKWYATHLAACLQVIGQRKETMLCESLCEFVKSFGKYLQMGLTDSESCKLVELFISHIRSECAVKRRCSAQNCISLIENSRNKSLMAKHGLHKVIEILLHDQRSHAVLGALGLLRILLPLIIRGFPDDCSNDESDNPPGKKASISLETADDGATVAAPSLMMKNECKQIIEIFDYCLHLLSTSHTSNHSIINASLEVINAILQAVEPGGSCSSLSNDNDFTTAQCLQQLLSNQQLQHNEYLRRRKSFKNQIFHSKNYEMTSAAAEATGAAAIEASNSTTRPPTVASTETPTRKRPQLITAEEAVTVAGASQGATIAVAEIRRDDNNDDDDEKELNKHKTSVGSASRKDERLFVALPDQNSACELGMQKVGDAKTVQQEVRIPKPTTTTTTTTTITTRAVIPTTIQGVHVYDDKRKNVTDDVDKHHNDDEDSKSPQKYPSKVGCTEQRLEDFKIIPGHNESKESGSKDDLEDGVDRVNTSKKLVELDNEVAVENEIDDDDDFTKLSEINEPHKAFAAVTAEPALTSTIDVVNLIDAIDATTESTHKTTTFELVEQQQQQQLRTSDASTVSASAIDQKSSQHLSDIDNESFKSIDFEAEIKIAGMSDESAATRADVAAGGAVVGGASNEATFGSFFNNLLTHPSTESMTKLFRSAAVKSSPIKTPGTSGSGAAAVELDGISINSSVAVSISATDTFSLDSMSSLSQTHEESAEKQAARIYSGSLNDETPSTTASVTASTAVLMDTNTRNTTAEVSTDEDEGQREQQQHQQQQQQQRQQQTPPQFEMRKRPSFNRIPNVNPFLKDSPLKQTAVELPQLQVRIGSIYEQPLIFYAGRLVAARFLLTGQTGGLQSDGTTRVSIKNLSLCVVAQCVRLLPQLLSHSLEISAFELQRLEVGVEVQHPSGSATARLLTPPTSTSSHSSSTSGSPTKAPSDSSSNLGKDYEHLDAGGEVLDFARSVKRTFASPFPSADLGSPKSLPKPEQSLPLNIKDDHFGVSTTDFFLTGQPLSRSIDSATFAAAAPLLGEKISIPKQKQKQQHMLLSKSEIMEKTFSKKVHQSVEDAVPSSPPPRPPKRMKSLRKQRIGTTSANKASDSSVAGAAAAAAVVDGVGKVRGRKVKPYQQLSDVVLFFKHPDPVLRGGVQHIIGNFIQASKATLRVDRHLQLNHLVAILVEGLQDEIHTVVIQALNAFDKAFPLVLAKYLAGTRSHCCSSSCNSGGTSSCCCHYQQQQHEQSKQTPTKAPFVEQQQSISSSCRKMSFQKNPNDAFTRKLYSSAADPCAAYSSSSAATTITAAAGTELFLDNDELIASILNAIQLKTKNDNQHEKEGEAMETAIYFNDIYDNNDPHVDDGLYKEQCIDSAAQAEAVEEGANITGRSIEGVALAAPALCISPKLLLNKLRLCYQHKYWLVQNKYAEVISNLNYAALREYYVEDSDLVTTYEQIFLDQLLQLIGEDDFRVREHAAECLSRFIIENAKCHHYQHQQEQQHKPQPINDFDSKASKFSSCSSSASACSSETFQTNFNLLWDFLDYRIFSGMSMPLRNLFTANSAIAPPLTKPTSSILSTSTSTSSTASSSSTSPASVRNTDCNRYVAFTVQRQIEQEQKLLAKVLYRLTNKLMELSDKNAQFGIIYTLKVLLKHFNFLDYHSVWTEFNFMEICMRFLYYNHATAVDLNCQNDLIDVTGKLMAGYILTSSHVPEQQQKHHQLIDTLLTHIMKITNIYHHIFSNQKPLLFGKTHKTDLFSSAKEVAIVQSWGYFGNDYVYLKLYSILRSANDSYKMTINQASGSILLSLLRTCINTLSLCVEMRSHGVGVTSNNNSNFMTLPQETCGASPSVPASALKLIEEILQYLTKLINYAAVESIACLRQLLKYLFARNYGNHQHDYATMTTTTPTTPTTPTTTMRTTFIQQFCRARTWPQQRQQHLQLPQSQQQQLQQRQPRRFEHTIVAGEMTTAPSAIVTCATNSRLATRRSSNNNSYNDVAYNLITAQTPPMHWEPQGWSVFGELIASVSRFCDEFQSGRENAEYATYIKIFEPLVINCLPLFLKSNALVQASILELLSQLLELNVTYSILDSKNMMFNQIINNLDLIESGIARNGHVIIPPTMRFLIQLTTKSDCKLITIPKIISIANNLLANNGIRQCAVLALKSLAYEIFFIDTEARNAVGAAALTQLEDQRATFQSPISTSPMATPEQLRRHQVSAQEAAAAAEMLLHISRELDTQKKVVLGMLEKFIDANECQHVLGLLLLRERSVVEASAVTMTTNRSGQQQQHQQTHPEDTRHQILLQDPGAVFGIVCRALCEGRIHVNEWSGFFVLDALFKNCGKLVLADSKVFLSLLQLLITKDVANFSNLSCATIILDNVILKTEEIYLVNHVKLYLKNHGIHRESQQHLLARLPDGPSTSMAAASALNSTLTSSGNNYNSNKGCSTGISSDSGHDNGNGISINEINFFAKVLYEKLDECFAKLTEHLGSSSNHLHNNSKSNNNNNNNNCSPDRKYCGLVVRFIKALHNVCCCSRLQDALQSVFRLVLDESNFLDKYLQMVTEGIDVAGHHLDEDASSLQLQLELVRLLSSLRLLDIFVVLQQLQAPAVKWSVRRTILLEICERNANQLECSPHQVEQLFHPAFLNILIADAFSFVCRICEVDEEFCSLWLRALIDNYAVLYRRSIRILARFAPRFCTHNNSVNCIAKFLHLLAKLHHHHRRGIDSERALEQLIERTARCLLSFAPLLDKNAIYDSFMRMNESEHREKRTGSPLNGGRLHYVLLNDLENLNTKANHLQFEQKIIDEKWLFAQLNKCSAQSDYDPEKLTRILLDVQSEHKLHKIFTTADFDTERLLAPAITCSLRAMLSSFRTNCIQHNPHIHYMQPNPLARVACAVLMSRIGELTAPSVAATTETTAASGTKAEAAFLRHSKLLHLAAAVVSLMEAVKQIQATALIYIEARFVEKFLQEHLLRHDNVAMLMRFLRHCCAVAKQSLILEAQTAVQCDGDGDAAGYGVRDGGPLPLIWSGTCSILRCIDELLKQQLIWKELNQLDGKGFSAFSMASPLHSTHSASATTGPILSQKQRNKLLCNLLEVLSLAAIKSIQTTLFYKQYKPFGGWRPCGVAGGTPIDSATVHVQHANNVCLLDAEDNMDDDENDDDESIAEALLADFFPAAIFIAKLIETQIDIIAASGALSSSHITGRAAAGVTAHCAAAGVASGRTGGAVGIAGARGGDALHVDDYFASSETEGAQVSLLNLLQSIGISILRTNQFYAYAMTPLEIVQQQEEQLLVVSSASSGSKERASSGRGAEAAVAAIALETPTKRSKTTGTTTRIGQLPTIPVDSLSDMDILRKFIKRLSIFGFNTRQQFEEHFMTFLLLINKVYDENMVDQQEQFQIKSTCLEAILELLITYKTFPIVGDKLSCFHHTPRWSRINCDGISLKKLHRVQILISESNIFYHPNLERHLSDSYINNSSAPDNVIGTKCFLTNQMDLSFVWQQMEAFTESPNNADDGNDHGRDTASLSASEGGAGGLNNNKSLSKERSMMVNSQDVGIKNYYYFTKKSGIDFKSSSQLIFDVMMQIIEYNHILVLPNLAKFCEICESRDQIKWIKDKTVKMQETIPVDDTISHQHIIYLLCKTQAMLIPTLSELQQLCTLIGNYLRSSHVFIRNATLAGLLSLLECCTKTNTSIGKLSEELSLLRELSIDYINRHGMIDKSSIQGSGLHARLVWTLNFALIEWTSKYVPQCHLMSNTIIATSPFLRKTTDVDVYLCVLHGLERMVVISTLPGNNNIVPQELRHKIEKLALDLVKLENEKFSIPGLKLLLSCMYVGSAKQLENTELSNGIVQDDPEIIAQQTDKVDVLLHCIKSSSRNAARIYGQVLCQIIRDLVPPNEILTKVIKEFLAINQPHCDVIAMIVYQVFRSAIDSSFLQMLQDWLICSLPTFLALSEQKAVWALSVIFLSASINVHLIKLFPVLLAARELRKLGQHEIALFVTAAQDFHARLSAEQSTRFREAFQKLQDNQIIAKMLQSL